MTQWVDALKEQSIPEYAKDTKLNIDAVVKRSTLPVEEAEAVALPVIASSRLRNEKLHAWLERKPVQFTILTVLAVSIG